VPWLTTGLSYRFVRDALKAVNPEPCSRTTRRISSGRPCALGKAYATRGVSTPHDTNQVTSSVGEMA